MNSELNNIFINCIDYNLRKRIALAKQIYAEAAYSRDKEKMFLTHFISKFKKKYFELKTEEDYIEYYFVEVINRSDLFEIYHEYSNGYFPPKEVDFFTMKVKRVLKLKGLFENE